MRITCGAACVLLALMIQSTAASADDADYAESVVRAVYYEGLPYSEAAKVSEAGAAHLIGMLRDPTESAQHANILSVLGMCGHPGSFEALVEFNSQLPRGEIDRSAFRAWRAVPGAMGYLARQDPRALAWLIQQVRAAGNDLPSFGRHDLARLRREAAAYALGTSGQAEARDVLNGLARPRAANTRSPARNGNDERFAQVLEGALELHANVAARDLSDAAKGASQ